MRAYPRSQNDRGGTVAGYHVHARSGVEQQDDVEEHRGSLLARATEYISTVFMKSVRPSPVENSKTGADDPSFVPSAILFVSSGYSYGGAYHGRTEIVRRAGKQCPRDLRRIRPTPRATGSGVWTWGTGEDGGLSE